MGKRIHRLFSEVCKTLPFKRGLLSMSLNSICLWGSSLRALRSVLSIQSGPGSNDNEGGLQNSSHTTGCILVSYHRHCIIVHRLYQTSIWLWKTSEFSMIVKYMVFYVNISKGWYASQWHPVPGKFPVLHYYNIYACIVKIKMHKIFLFC